MVAQNAGDILLNYPQEIPVDTLCDGGHQNGPRLLHWWTLDGTSLPHGLQSVLSTCGAGL